MVKTMGYDKTVRVPYKKVGSSFVKDEPTYSFWVLPIYNTSRSPNWNLRPWMGA